MCTLCVKFRLLGQGCRNSEETWFIVLSYVRLGYNWQSAIGGALDLETREQKNKLKKSVTVTATKNAQQPFRSTKDLGHLISTVYQTLLLQYVVCWTMLIQEASHAPGFFWNMLFRVVHRQIWIKTPTENTDIFN